MYSFVNFDALSSRWLSQNSMNVYSEIYRVFKLKSYSVSVTDTCHGYLSNEQKLVKKSLARAVWY